LEVRWKYDDKRRFGRLQVDAELTYTVPDDNTTYRGRCKNLSHSGIQFITENALSEGKSVEVTIDTRSSKFKPMKARVEIIRVEPSEDNNYKAAGIIVEYK
jgi:c-di-GMP-binding flagellar brake protein YcgR